MFLGITSTKGLFLANLVLVKRDERKDTLYYTEPNGINYPTIIVKKDYNSIGECEYKDIFTNTIYSSSETRESLIKANEIIIHNLQPFVTNRKYISRGEAMFILQKYNPTFLDLKKEKTLIK